MVKCIDVLFLSTKLDFKSSILRQENMVAFLETNRDQLAILIAVTRPNSHDFARVQLDPQEHSQVMG